MLIMTYRKYTHICMLERQHVRKHIDIQRTQTKAHIHRIKFLLQTKKITVLIGLF